MSKRKKFKEYMMEKKQKVKIEKSNYLRDDIKEIIIETDEKDSKTVAVIGDVLKPSEGYRVRVKFRFD